MAHFAQIDDKNRVINVLVVPNDQEHRGQEFLAIDLGLGGRWIQTSYNGKIRKQYAGLDYFYDEVADVFISPQPYPSWTLDSNFDWQAPKPRPEGQIWIWDEDILEWVNVEGNA